MEAKVKIVKVDTNRLWISNKEAASYLGVSKDWLKDRRNDGLLHYSVVGNTIFYIKKEIGDLVRGGAVSGRSSFQRAV